MTETERIQMQTDLTTIIDEWLDKQEETVYRCAELGRMMAVAALAVAEASTLASQENT